MGITETKIESLGVKLPKPTKPVANYVPFKRVGSLLFVSGQLPFGLDGKIAAASIGKLGLDSGVEAASEAARLCAINVIAQAKAAVGELDRISQVVRLGGFFNVNATFGLLTSAMNGASDLMVAVFGERGLHARTAAGAAYLPFDALAEVEAIFEITA